MAGITGIFNLKFDPNQRYEWIEFAQANIPPNLPVNEIDWTLRGDFSRDFVAGLIIGFYICIQDLEIHHGYERDNFINVGWNTGSLLILFNPDSFNQKLSEYIIRERYLFTDWNHYRPNEGKYGWWLREETNMVKYRIYQFESLDFIQGFITAMQAFSVDFRQYVLGPPFQIINGKKVAYTIEGYDIDLTLVERPPPRQDDEYTKNIFAYK